MILQLFYDNLENELVRVDNSLYGYSESMTLQFNNSAILYQSDSNTSLI